MLVILGALVQLCLEDLAGNGGGMLEYQSAAQVSGCEEDPHPTY